MKTDTRVLFSCHQTWAIYKESKEIILSLEQCKLLRVFDAVSLQCLWLVIKETICSQGRNKVHDKVAYRSMAWVYNLCRILQHVVNGFDNVSLAQHHSVIERHQLVFHVYAQPCHQLYSILKEEVKQLLWNIAFVSEQLAIQPFSKNLEHIRVLVTDICASKYKRYYLTSVIARKSLWNVALEVHSGRIFIGTIATYIFIFVMGILAFWCLWSGYKIRLKKK